MVVGGGEYVVGKQEIQLQMKTPFEIETNYCYTVKFLISYWIPGITFGVDVTKCACHDKMVCTNDQV